MSASFVIQLHHREAFDKNAGRSLWAGALAGLFTFVLHRAGLTSLPLGALVCLAAVGACIRGDRWDVRLLWGLGVVAALFPWGADLPRTWAALCWGLAAGGLMVRARLCERGEEGSVGRARPGRAHYLATALLAAGACLLGVQLMPNLFALLSTFGAPQAVVWAAAGSGLCLFLVLSSIAAHCALEPDPVDAQCEQLIPSLEGELQTLSSRVLQAYRQCGESLALLPRQPAREELARTLSQLTLRAVELAAECAGVDNQLKAAASDELATQVRELEASSVAARDEVAKRQLQSAADSLKEELAQLAGLELSRERIIARLKSEAALLDRARIALIGLRSGHTQLKAAELSALAKKLSRLASGQSLEAQAADGAATEAFLADRQPRTAEPHAPEVARS